MARRTIATEQARWTCSSITIGRVIRFAHHCICTGGIFRAIVILFPVGFHRRCVINRYRFSTRIITICYCTCARIRRTTGRAFVCNAVLAIITGFAFFRRTVVRATRAYYAVTTWFTCWICAALVSGQIPSITIHSICTCRIIFAVEIHSAAVCGNCTIVNRFNRAGDKTLCVAGRAAVGFSAIWTGCTTPSRAHRDTAAARTEHIIWACHMCRTVIVFTGLALCHRL